MEKTKRLIVIILIIIFFTPLSEASSLKESLKQAVSYFKTNPEFISGKNIVINIVNYHSQKSDQLAQKIETELYFTFETQLPGINLILLSESIVGVSSSNSIFLKGTYQQTGETITLNLFALRGALTGEVIAQTKINFEIQKARKRNLVAVLDIEAEFINENQRKAYSELLKSALIKTDSFDLASSAEVDKMNPEDVQKATGCSRDECATVIGEQLGVDRVISTTIFQMGKNNYIISSKMIDIRNGSIINSVTLEHKEKLDTLGNTLNILAGKLVGKINSVQFLENLSSVSFSGGVERITPKLSGDRKSQVAALFIDSTPQKAEVYFGSIKAGITPYQNMRLKPGQQLKVTLKHPDTYNKILVMTLKGGINEVGPIKLNSKYGSLVVNSDPQGASVYLAGEKVGTTPYQNNHILSGSYLISLNYSLYFSEENHQIKIQAEKQTTKQFILKPNFGTLNIETNPPSAEIKIYNQENEQVSKANSPIEKKLTPGKYRLEISKNGYAPLDYKITIAKGRTEAILESEATLRRLEGHLFVGSIPYQKGADVMIDGEKMGEVPANLTLPAGEYSVEVISEDKTGMKQITIQDGLTESLTIDIYDRFSRQELIDQHDWWYWKWGSAATGGIIAGLYSYMEYQKALEASSKQKMEENAIVDGDSEAEGKAHRDSALDYNSQVITHNSNSQNGAILSIGLLGIAFWIWSDEPKNPESAYWQPEIDYRGNLRLSFAIDF